ncbi:unnamed protein product, partial [Amoebophrya sp. A120]|eukprot:GSA120T00025398001.1
MQLAEDQAEQKELEKLSNIAKGIGAGKSDAQQNGATPAAENEKSSSSSSLQLMTQRKMGSFFNRGSGAEE